MTPKIQNKDMSRLSQKVRKELVTLAKYSPKESKFLGKDKFGDNYEAQIRNSMDRYERLRTKRENLFAFIMPAGHGKTTLAYKYGFVDVDQLIDSKTHNDLVAIRAAMLGGFDGWSGHNKRWYGTMNKTLDMLDYSMPVIILVHTEEAAREIGAMPIGALRLERDAFERNIRDRDDMGKHFSRMNYESMQTSGFVTNRFTCRTNQDLEAQMLAILNFSDFPVACPLKYSDQHWNESYAPTVDSWILKGERTGDPSVDINYLRLLHDKGDVPKECVDYYVRHSGVPTQFDFGVTMFEWSTLFGEISAHINDHQDFNVGEDMLEVFPPQGPKDVARANVTVRHLVQTFDVFSHIDAYEVAARHVGEPQIFVSSILCAWKGILQKTSVAPFVKEWLGVSFNYWTKAMKDIHSYVRTSRYIMNTPIDESERQSLMYMDLLVGRHEYIIDEMAEVHVRGGDTYSSKHLSYDPSKKMYTNRQYKDDFSAAIQEAYYRIKSTPRKVNLESFHEFYQRRATWITKGGLVHNTLPPGMKTFVSKVLDPVNELVDEIRGRHNKKSLFEMNDLLDVVRGVSKENFNLTKTMIKYEVGGKDRTLLPGSLAHFIVFSYILVLAEKQDQIGSVRLNAASDGDIRYFDKKMSTGLYHVLYDWADFNEQHSAEEMVAVIKGLEDVMPQGHDYSLFTGAIIEGMFNMGLEDRDGHVHKLWRGLYSGWRGTTWVNTVLNFCYVSVGLKNLERLSGMSVVLMVDHGGDDLDLMLSQPSVMPMFLQIMDDMLFKANRWKQMFGIRSEFFRNTISGARVYASPTRAISSFVAGDWEGAGRATVRERVVSLLDQIGKLRRRGVSNELCQGLTISCISHWCKVKDGEEWVNLPPEIIHGCEDQNGLGVPDKNGDVWVLSQDVPEMSSDWYKVVVPDYKASKDYVKVLSSELDRFSLVIERQEQLAQKLAQSSYDMEFTLDRLEWKRMLSFKAKVVGKKKIIEPIEDHTVFQLFMDFEITDDLVVKLDRAARYQEYVGYLTIGGDHVSAEELVALMSDGEVSLEAVEFQGDMHYQRLVPEFIATRAVYFCKAGINTGLVSTELASKVFKTVCWMGSDIFRHMM